MAETEIPQDVRKLAAILTRNLVGTSVGYSRAQALAVEAIIADRAARAPELLALRQLLGKAGDALGELVDTLTPAEREPIRDPAYDDEVRALGLRIGFEALMATADYEWRAWLKENGYPLGGEHVAGPCRAVLQSDLRRARAALSAIEAAPK